MHLRLTCRHSIRDQAQRLSRQRSQAYGRTPKEQPIPLTSHIPCAATGKGPITEESENRGSSRSTISRRCIDDDRVGIAGLVLRPDNDRPVTRALRHRGRQQALSNS